MDKIEKRHTIDILFVMTLFCVFSISVLAVVYIGSQVYASVSDTMEVNFNENTAMDYIVEKIRLGNEKDCISVKKVDGVDVLCIDSSYNNTLYTTYIYVYNQHLQELFIEHNETFSLSNGESLLEIDDLSFKIKDALLTIELTVDHSSYSRNISLLGGTDYEK